ncbi:FAD-binding oxidoreductase [Nocardia cyriacigeorgica]|uniref:FAD-binding oxidoreductase n=1 Tax=Nocardia cyriacigeorgica TaxID=135487 RepID=UPI002453D58C|nr:FAD-binding protein [Nocardia cyriacigeorgica]
MGNIAAEHTALTPAAEAELASFSAPVLRPGDADYPAEVAGFQTAYQHRPAIVIAARHTEDVRAAVEFAARHALPVAVQATGHGLSVAADGGVLISTRRMTGIDIDAAAAPPPPFPHGTPDRPPPVVGGVLGPVRLPYRLIRRDRTRIRAQGRIA